MDDRYKDRYEKIGLMISIYRRKKRLTQKQLGEIIGIDAQHLSRIERATSGMSFDMFFKIADALECEARDLMNFELIDIGK